MDQGDMEGAVGELEKAVEQCSELWGKKPDDESAQNLRAALTSQARVPRQQDRHAEAIAHLNRALFFHRNDHRQWSELAQCHLALGNKPEYEQAYHAIIGQFPPPNRRSVADWGHLGQALYRAGRYPEARQALQKAIEIRGDKGPSIERGPRWWYYIMTLCRFGETDKARSYYQQLAEATKQNPSAEQQVASALPGRSRRAFGREQPPGQVRSTEVKVPERKDRVY